MFVEDMGWRENCPDNVSSGIGGAIVCPMVFLTSSYNNDNFCDGMGATILASGPSEMTPLIRDCLGVETPRASAFIVTIYGDVVVPRGGVLWIGNLIECCSVQGISETLVRTAVSRLMSAGRLQSKRLGRKSFYGLTKAAQEEFRDAANILYTPEPEPAGWLIEIGNPRSDEEKAHGWVSVASNLAIAPNRADVRKSAGLVMSAETISGVERLPQFAADHWAMAEVAAKARLAGGLRHDL